LIFIIIIIIIIDLLFGFDVFYQIVKKAFQFYVKFRIILIFVISK